MVTSVKLNSTQLKAEESKGTILWEIKNASQDTWNEAEVRFEYQDYDGENTASVELSKVTKPTETLSVYNSDLRPEFQGTDVKIRKIVCLFFKTDKGETVRADPKEAPNNDWLADINKYCYIAPTKASDNYKAQYGFVKFRGTVTLDF